MRLLGGLFLSLALWALGGHERERRVQFAAAANVYQRTSCQIQLVIKVYF